MGSTKKNLFPGKQFSQTFKKEIRKTVKGNYLLYLPDNYAENNKKWPMVLFLHGAGERGDDLDLLKNHGLPKLIEQGRSFPFIVLSPQCHENQRWSIEFLNALLNETVSRYEIDENRLYVTGLSMGGFGTWELALKYPDRFAAIAPVCGGADPKKAFLIKHLPVWAFHGAKDKIVPVERSMAMVDALKILGGNVKFTVYPDIGHDSWTQTYENQELYDWLLRHHRGNLPT
ncbi:MAG: prolyl oligopeptidase family serine peptidase [Calditrichaceae bacterium]